MIGSYLNPYSIKQCDIRKKFTSSFLADFKSQAKDNAEFLAKLKDFAKKIDKFNIETCELLLPYLEFETSLMPQTKQPKVSASDA